MSDMRVLVVMALLLGACTDGDSGSGGPEGNSHVQTYEVAARLPPKFDLLFVVDDTTAMAAHQEALVEIAAALETTLEEEPDVNIAVTTASVAAAGELRAPPGTTEPYLSRTLAPDFTVASNFQGTLASALAALLDVGASGTEAVEPLAVMPLVLADSFVRADASLGVITIAASDDASPDAVANYAAALKATKTDPLAVVVAGIYPTPATRLDAFFAEFPDRSTVTSIDAAVFEPAFELIPSLRRTLLGYRCFEEPADLDPATAGPQYDCALAAHFGDGTAQTLPHCSTQQERCYEFVVDPTSCPDGSENALFVVRGFVGPYHPAVRGQCIVTR